MKIAIVGGGFGLYGYLPALLKISDFTIILPRRYQERIKARNDISGFYNVIEWVSSDEHLLELCEGIIIALPPMQQYLWVKKILDCKHISHIFLEKPVAPTPILATQLINDLILSGKKFRIGYNFRYTDWGMTLLRNSIGIERISWDFQAYHYAQNVKTWKRKHSEGGGALRFYGIHLIALLAELGYSEVSYSEVKAKQSNEAENWNAELIGSALSPCSLVVTSNVRNTGFLIKQSNGKGYSLLHPFQEAIRKDKNKTIDQRIPFLTAALSDLFYKEQRFYEWYRCTNLLWNNIEKRTLLQ